MISKRSDQTKDCWVYEIYDTYGISSWDWNQSGNIHYRALNATILQVDEVLRNLNTLHGNPINRLRFSIQFEHNFVENIATKETFKCLSCVNI